MTPLTSDSLPRDLMKCPVHNAWIKKGFKYINGERHFFRYCTVCMQEKPVAPVQKLRIGRM